MKIITGMHRSGTSLVARLFFEAGADLGDPATFYRPDRWNPDGYFEQPDIHAINMPLFNGAWGRFSYLAPPSTAAILRRGARRAAQIRDTSAGYRDKVVKDCRYCFTLPAWTAQDVRVDAILVCLRDPIAVARSLHKRNRATQRHAYRLWLLHNERLLENAGEIPLHFTYYGNLFDEEGFQEEMSSAFQFFGMEVADDQLAAIRARCVKPQLNHSRGVRATYPEKIDARWREIRELHGRQFDGTGVWAGT